MSYLKLYAYFLKNRLKLKSPLRVVFDCSNGTTGLILPKLKIENCKFKILNAKPDGRFPAHGPNPMAEGAMNDLSKAVLKNKADLGVIFDADGDRAFFIDDLGRPVQSALAAFMIGQDVKGTIILDLLAGYRGKDLVSRGKKIFESRVGSYFMKKLMKEKKAKFGAENSGHYYFPADGTFFDSGILAAIYLMNQESRIRNQGIRLSEWIDSLPHYYRSPELNFEIADKAGMLKITEERYADQAQSISHLDGLKMEFGEWWFNLRPSNTEDLLRLNLEAKNEQVYRQKLSELEMLLKKR